MAGTSAASPPRRYLFPAPGCVCALAQLSRSVTVRLNTSAPGFDSSGSEIIMRHRTSQFSHLFAGDGYSAGYYSYLWSDVITADAYGAFTEVRRPYAEAAARLKRLLSIGNTVDPADAYRARTGSARRGAHAQTRLCGSVISAVVRAEIR